MFLRYLMVGNLQKLLHVPGENTQFLLYAGTTAAFQCLRSKSHSLDGSPYYCRY